MALIYKVTPQVADLQNDLTGRDEVPQQTIVSDLKTWLSTPMGVAYFNWARQVPKWDVNDMTSEKVYSVGSGANKIFWVPARNNGVRGSAGRYYWVPVKISEDLDAEAQAAADEIAAQIERKKILDAAAGITTTTGIPGYTGTLPPGPGTVLTGGPQRAIQSIEFSVADDGFWVAKTPAASAANKDGNPHAGISIINPGEWERVAGGMSITEALSLDDYKKKGWLGLDKHFLAWQGSDSSPAGEELSSAMDAYEQEGDQGAYRALRAVGVSPPKNMQGGAGGHGLFGSLGFNF